MRAAWYVERERELCTKLGIYGDMIRVTSSLCSHTNMSYVQSSRGSNEVPPEMIVVFIGNKVCGKDQCLMEFGYIV